MELINKWVREVHINRALRFYFFHKKDSEWAFHYVGIFGTVENFLAMESRPVCFGSYMTSRKVWVRDFRPKLIQGNDFIVVNDDIAVVCDLWIEKAGPDYVAPSDYFW